MRDTFRIAVVFSPTRLVNIGVVAGDYGKACDYILEIQPLIDDFLAKVRAQTPQILTSPRRTRQEGSRHVR